jgi:cell cycle sensor histidine kinase DivJ
LSQVLGAVLDRVVHPDARRDRRVAEAHLRFIAARLLFVCLACALLPIILLVSGGLPVVSLVLVGSIALLLVPALYVARTGRLDHGHDVSSCLLSGSIVALAVQSGGLQSPFVTLFAVVLLDTALSGKRRALTGALVACLCGLVAIAALPYSGESTGLVVPIVAATLVTYTLAIAWIFVERGERQATSQMRSRARATAALDNVSDVVLWREAGGEISFANAAAHAQLGLDRRAFNETMLFERVNVGDRPAYLKAIADARHGDGHGHAVIRLAVDAEAARQGRDVRVFEMSARRVGQGVSEEAIVIGLRDVTERHAADAVREVARQEAERIATSKSQFLATMSHELRTPLNAIIGFSELLVQPGMVPPDDPRRDEYARIINGSGQHLLEVVNAILDMSKIESGMMTVEQERVEVGQVIRSSRELLAVRAADKAVALTESLAPDLPDLIADRRALKQVLLNLMSNAVKFTPHGGDVTVTAVRDRDHVEIVVADNGCGIAEADLTQLGAPFFQARQSYDRQHEGTGLGLSVVRGLLGLMGGSMMIESAPGVGTRVAIRMPIGGKGADRSSEPVSILTRISARRPALDGLASGQQAITPLRRSA